MPNTLRAEVKGNVHAYGNTVFGPKVLLKANMLRIPTLLTLGFFFAVAQKQNQIIQCAERAQSDPNTHTHTSRP